MTNRDPLTGRFISKGKKAMNTNYILRDAIRIVNVQSNEIKERTTPAPASTAHVFGAGVEIHKPFAVLSDYPHCCGAGIINGLGYDSKIFKKDVPYLVRQAQTMRKGLVLCIINHTQVNAGFDKILEQNDFVRSNDGVTNPVHGDATSVYLYSKLIGAKTIAKDGVAVTNKGI